jgi:hypothetical protein
MADVETLQNRITRFRLMAEEAEIFAKCSMYPETRRDYLKLAYDWRMRASELERYPNSN